DDFAIAARLAALHHAWQGPYRSSFSQFRLGTPRRGARALFFRRAQRRRSHSCRLFAATQRRDCGRDRNVAGATRRGITGAHTLRTAGLQIFRETLTKAKCRALAAIRSSYPLGFCRLFWIRYTWTAKSLALTNQLNR